MQSMTVGGVRFGAGLAVLDDLDGDGLPEIAVGAPESRAVGNSTGSVLILDGRTWRVVRRIDGVPDRRWFGWTMSRVEDLDGDGRCELAVEDWAAERTGHPTIDARHSLTLVSSGSAAKLRVLPGNERWLGDAGTGDGRLCILRSATNSCSVLSTTLFTQVRSIQDASWREMCCVSGDHDRNDFSFVTVAVDGEKTRIALRGLGEKPEIESTCTWPLLAVDRSELYGVCALRLDLDGDHVPELVGGFPNANGEAGVVVILSGKDVAVLRTHTLFKGSNREGDETEFGHSLAAVPDVDGDGIEEIAVGAPGWPSRDSGVHLLSGVTGKKLWFYLDGQRGGELGTNLSIYPDLDGDGRADLLVTGGDYDIHGEWYDNASLRVLSSRTGRCLRYVSEHDYPELSVTSVH